MRFRRETGDFLIKGSTTITTDPETGEETDVTTTYNTIRPGLSMEDLMGEMVAYYIDGKMATIDSVIYVSVDANDANSLILYMASTAQAIYNRTTGAIAYAESAIHDASELPSPGVSAGDSTVDLGGGQSV